MATVNDIAGWLMQPPPPPFEKTRPFNQFYNAANARKGAHKEFDPYFNRKGREGSQDYRKTLKRGKQDFRRARRGLNVARSRIGIDYAIAQGQTNQMRRRSGEDLSTSLNEITRNRGMATQDKTETLARLLNDRITSRTGEDMAYNPQVENTMQNIALAGNTFSGRRRAALQGIEGERAMRINGINTEYARGATDTNTQFDRTMTGLNENERLARQGYGRTQWEIGQQELGNRNERKRGLGDLSREWDEYRTGYKRNVHDENLKWSRGKKDRKRDRRIAIEKEVLRREGIAREKYRSEENRYYNTYPNYQF